MEREHAVPIIRVHDAEALPAQSGMAPAQLDQLARKAHVIEHLLVAVVEARPVKQQVRVCLDIVRPLLVLEELLAHEEHRDTGRGQAEARRHARPAAAEPRARIAEVAEPRDARLAALIHDVVVLRALHEAPLLHETLRP